ncbi:MAG: protein DpdF [Thermoguttaceae bacterium]
MISPLRDFQALVLSGKSVPPFSTSNDHLLCRVRNVVECLASRPSDVGPGDIAALIRQSILRSHLVLGDEPELRVPREEGWPDERDWQQFGCDARVAGAGHYLVQPRPWNPVWLDQDAPSVVEAAIKQVDRRPSRLVPSDPLVSEYTGLQQYVSPGQRTAVQAAFLIPPGSTAVISLPTGGGKTLAFQLPSLAWANQGGITLVIVPTVALAKDQEERFRELLHEQKKNRSEDLPPLAYHSGLNEDVKNAVRSAIRSGSLPIVFASPEAVMGALRGPLFDAARQGRLRCFAVDEAHIVTQWGHQFRPEFQSIAGLKDALLDVCPPTALFRTLLLTATLTPECWEALRFLFGRGGCQLISEVALRPEPGFLLFSAPDEVDRERRVLEAMRRLPRPLILYTTLREHAEHWYYTLIGSGFRRLRMVRGGDLADAEGEQLLRDWRDRSVDIVVATSAFGLGMDQAEIRSVVHACLPETIDRYYQEVGRAGRDGKAATALLVSTPEDLTIAEGLTRERLISVDRGFERWDAMWVRRRAAENDTFVVSLDDRPADIADTGIRNASWNLRTLVLMARAGLIGFTPHPPPVVEQGDDEDAAVFEERRRRIFERFSREVGIRIHDSHHSDKAHWNSVVASTRATLRTADGHAAALVRELRDLRRPLNDIFREVYTLTDPPVRPPRMPGSCPVTRRDHTVSFQCADPEITVVTATVARLSAELERAIAPCSDDVGRSWVACEAISREPREFRRWREALLSLLRYMVAGGIVELSVRDGILSAKDWAQLTMRSPQNFLIRGSVAGDRGAADVPVPRLTLVDEQHVTPIDVEQVMMVHRPRHIIVVPPNAPDPRLPRRRLLDMVRHLSIQDLLARLQS